MAIKTLDIHAINYGFKLPPGIQLSTEQMRSSGSLLPKNDSTSSTPLLGRAQALAQSLKNIDLKSLESFIEIPIRASSDADGLPFLTSGATATEDNIANISYFIRTLMPEAVATEAIGVTTGENVFQGMWAAIKSAARFKSAHAIGDTGGMIEGGTDAIRGVSQSLGGAAYLGYRGTMIAADIHKLDTTVKATTPVGKAAYGLGMVGNVLFTIFYLMIAIWSAYSFAKDWQFGAAMKAHEGSDTGMFEFLMQKVKADPKAKLEKLAAYWKTLPPEKQTQQFMSFKKNLSKTALDAMADQFIHLQNEALKAGNPEGRKLLSKSEAKDVLKMLFAGRDGELRKSGAYANYLSSLGLQQEDVKDFDFSALELIGFKLQELKRQNKKDAKISRVTDDACVAAVKKAAGRGLSARLLSDDPLIKGTAHKEISELKGKVASTNKINKVFHGALIVVGVLGIVASILGFLALPPAGIIALTVITLLLCIGMMATDGYCMVQGWNSGAPGAHDKKYLAIISTVIIVALVASVVVTLHFGLPIMPLILALIIGGMGLGLSGLAYYKLRCKEKKWQEDHPDLSVFQKFLSAQIATGVDESLDEKTMALFKKLPKAHRRAVREKYFKMSGEGEQKFKTAKYQALDASYDFGSAYIFSQAKPESMSNAKEHELFVRGMKKSVKFFWKKWEAAQTEENKQIALKMQALFERVSQKNVQDLHEKLCSVMLNQEAYLRLKADLWYVVKRQESKGDLYNAIGAVIADEAQKSAAPASPSGSNLLTERVADVFNQHRHVEAA